MGSALTRGPRRRELTERYASSSIVIAALISARWLSAWGRFPTKSRVSASIISA